MTSLIIAIASFVCVAAMVGGVAMAFRGNGSTKAEDRLDTLTGVGVSSMGDKAMESSVLSQPLDALPSFSENLLNKFGNFTRIFEQADTTLTMPRFVLISSVMAVLGAGFGAAVGIHPGFMPALGLVMAILPLMWLLMRRKRRMKAFGCQLPAALDMLSRALRAGHRLSRSAPAPRGPFPAAPAPRRADSR